MSKPIRLKRIESGLYETRDGQWEIIHCDEPGYRLSWIISKWVDGEWLYQCEVETLGDVRRYLAGELGLASTAITETDEPRSEE